MIVTPFLCILLYWSIGYFIDRLINDDLMDHPYMTDEEVSMERWFAMFGWPGLFVDLILSWIRK